MSGDALLILTKMSEEVSLRYAMQLISNADVVRQRRKGTEVTPDDVKRVFNMFFDIERVKTLLKK